MSFTATITANVTDFEKGVQQAQKSIDGLEKSVSSSLSKIGDKFTNIGQKMSIASAAIIAAGAASFKMAADFEDAMGATDQIFKQNAKVVQDWASNLPSMYGIAKKEALEYANIMGSMLVNIGGLTQEQAAKQSASLIQLAGDLTAMFGGTTQDAVRALTGALKGNNTMLDNYGMAVNDTLVKQRAFELGLISQGDELSLVAKQAATLSLIYEQSGAAQGQAAREADGASGAMRSLGVEFKNLVTELGEVLLPVLTPIVAKLRDLTARFRDISPEALQTGIKIAGLVAAIGPILVIIGKLIAILPALKAGFSALTSPIGLIVAAIAGAAYLIISNWDTIKEYFTTGGGAEMFTAIKELAQSVFSRIVTIFNAIKGFITTVWGAIGEDVKAVWGAAISAVGELLDYFMDYIRTAANFWKAIVDLDFKGALEALKENFNVIFNFIGRIVTSALSGVAGALAGFLKTLGLDKWSASVQSFANKMGSAFVNPKAEIAATTEVIEAQKEAIQEIVPVIKTLTTSLKELGVFDKLVGDGSDINYIVARTAVQIQLMTERLEGLRSGTIAVKNVKAEIEATEKAVGELNTAFTTLTGLSPELATMKPKSTGLDKVAVDSNATPIKIAGDQILDDINTFKENLFDGLVDLSNIAAQGVGAFAETIGNAFGSGNFKGLGSGLLSALGGLAQQMGSMLIGLGVAALKLKVLIANPLTAIAAGAALVALGAAASASASKMVQSTTSGGGGYSSGGASGSYQNTSSVGASDYRGQYRDDYVVNFKIGSNELVGVLDMANDRKNRL